VYVSRFVSQSLWTWEASGMYSCGTLFISFEGRV
jgi:hypothetical protein